ncbi:MAG: hypothetical protein U5L02_15580 [Rheinheimera sp.]|nr:hypothetical protein [Rheinheimera sp.]
MNLFPYQVFSTSLTFIPLLALAVLHLIFAVGVFQTACRGQQHGGRCWLVSPIYWAFGTLLLGPFFAAVYWAMHHSAFGGFDQSALAAVRQRRQQSTETKPE